MVLAAFACACGSKSSEPEKSGSGSGSGNTVVRVDLRLELVAIVEHLAGTRGYTQTQAKAYLHDVDTVFGKFRDHAAVADAVALKDTGLAFDRAVTFALCLDDHLAIQCDLSQFDWYSPKQRPDLEKFAADLGAFSTASDATTFFRRHQGYYDLVSQRVAETVEGEHARDWFDEIYGPVKGATFAVNPGLIEGTWSFSLHVQRGDTLELVAVLGLWKLDDKNLPIIDELGIATLVHEMAHSYVNPVLDAHAKELEKPMSALFAYVAPQMREAAYPSWKLFANEQVVRATTVLYLRDRKGAQAAADATRDEMHRSFLWTAELADTLAAARKSGGPHALEAYVPALVASASELAAKEAAGVKRPFLGPMGVAWRGQPKVVSGVPGDDAVAVELARVKGEVSATGVKLGARTFDGPHLVLGFCHPRQDDPTQAVVTYVAADGTDVAGASEQLRPGTDWVVARADRGKLVVIAQGDFPHASDGAWLPAK